MFSRLHNRLGTAGLVVAVIALVAALAGTAFAATKLNGTQKKEVEKIAKKYAGKNGTNGTNGTNGAAGANGKDGTNGTAGTAGAAGKSVVLTTEPPGPTNCEEGGTKVEVEGNAASKKYVCNGEEGPEGDPGTPGSPWVAGTAPAGATLKGTWSIPYYNAAGSGELAFASISTGVPIPQPPAGVEFIVVRDPSYVFPVEEAQENAEFLCPGTAENPTVATPFTHGVLCVYVASRTNLTPPEPASTGGSPPTWPLASSAAGGGGFLAGFETAGAGVAKAYGSWAMKLK